MTNILDDYLINKINVLDKEDTQKQITTFKRVI